MSETDSFIKDLTGGRYKKVVVISGAGCSTNAGIPDYRSKDGIFAQLADSDDIPNCRRPEDLFSRKFVDEHPEIKQHPLVKQFRSQMMKAEPTPSHLLTKWLDERGILKRVFTQNIDGLYQRTGLPENKVVEYHGNYLKETTVLYGDPIPTSATWQAHQDLIVDRTNQGRMSGNGEGQEEPVDCLIVMGTSLQVAPFCALPNTVDSECTRVLVDIKPSNAVSNPWTPGHHGGRSSNGYVGFPHINLGGQKVALGSFWKNSKRYPHQYIFQEDCDSWSQRIMSINK